MGGTGGGEQGDGVQRVSGAGGGEQGVGGAAGEAPAPGERRSCLPVGWTARDGMAAQARACSWFGGQRAVEREHGAEGADSLCSHRCGAAVVALDAPNGDDAVMAQPHSLSDQELELADLVAALQQQQRVAARLSGCGAHTSSRAERGAWIGLRSVTLAHSLRRWVGTWG